MQIFGIAIRSALFALMLAMSLAGVSIAGPFENADAAYSKGDHAAAMRLWKQLADQGHARAQYSLGNMYYFGEGIPMDSAEGMKWWRKAANQGHARAQFNLGNTYYYGDGVEENIAVAVKWYRRAANLGFARAQVNLGFMYRLGEGVPQDDVQAYKWWYLAAAQGDEVASTNMTNIAEKMTREQIARARRLSSDWKPTPN